MRQDRSWVRARAQFVITAVLAAVLVGLLLVPQNAIAAPVASPAAGAAKASAARSATGASVAQMLQYVYDAQNAVRYDAGLSTGYARDARLDKVAADWAYQQWRNGAMSHNPKYAAQIPGGWQRAGENVASGYSYTQVVPAWVASPSHYANIVRDYTSVGIGFYEANGARYWSVVFAKYPGTSVPARPATPPAATPPSPPVTYAAEPASPAGAVFPLRSPSFEGGASGWSGGNGVEGPTTAARGGRYDLVLSGGTVAQTVPVATRVGESYTATVWVRNSGGAAGGTVRLVATGGTAETASIAVGVSSGSWTRVTLTLPISRSGHTALRLEVQLTRGELRVDSASLVRTADAPAPAPAPPAPPAASATPPAAPAPAPAPAPAKPSSSGGGLLGGLLSGLTGSTPAPPPPPPAAPPAPPAPPAAPAPPAPAPSSGGLLGGLLGGLGL